MQVGDKVICIVKNHYSFGLDINYEIDGIIKFLRTDVNKFKLLTEYRDELIDEICM